MDTGKLSALLRDRYGIEAAVEFLREGGSKTYIVNSDRKYLLKVVGAAFSDTARRSVSVMRYLEEKGFPVPKIIPTVDGELVTEADIDGGKHVIVLQEFIEGDEPDLAEDAEAVGALAGRLHSLLESYPEMPTEHDRHFFIGRYLDFLKSKEYPKYAEYEQIGENLWERVKNQPKRICHGDLHRGNLLKTAGGEIFLCDFDTVCRAPLVFDIMTMCDMTDYFRLKEEDIDLTKAVYKRFLSEYSCVCDLAREEERSFPYWVAIRHFQLQATIVEIHGADCIDEKFIDWQLLWLNKWTEAAKTFFER